MNDLENINNENFSLKLLIESIATILTNTFKLPVYSNPGIQGVKLPCFFIQIFNYNPMIEKEVGDHIYIFNTSVIITYLPKTNNVNQNYEFYDIIDTLNYKLDSIEILNEEDPSYKIKAFDRTPEIYLNELKYKFNVNVRLIKKHTLPEKLKSINLDLHNNKKGGVYATITIPRNKK